MKPTRYLILFLTCIPALVLTQTTDGQDVSSIPLVPATITFQTNPPGRTVIVDGFTYTTPHTTTWTQGTSHTISTRSPQTAGADTQYVFSSWSDAGLQSHTVTAPKNAKTYTANFTTQYYLTMAASPLSGGAVTPSSGWRSRGQVISINATPGSGYSFSSWSGTGSGSYTGTTKAAQITMNGPIAETGNFVVSTQPVLSVQPPDRPVSSSAGTTTFDVSNSGTGTMNWIASSNQIWAVVSGGASGTNSGTITVSYSANPSSIDSRVATITVTASGATGSPQAVTVTQAPTSQLPTVTDTTSMSDDFRGSTLNGGLWTFVDPVGDVTVSVVNDVLSLAVPGGTAHEPWTSGNSAPRVMQTVDPAQNVAGWTVRFNTVPAGSDSNMPMQGMILEQDSANYLRFDLFSDGSSVYAYAAGFTNGPTNPQMYITTPIPVPGPPVWICVTREGSQWRYYYSLDGISVFTATAFERDLTLHRVGVFAGNAGISPEAFNCRVDYFQGALPAKAYLSSPLDKATDVARPVSFVWQPSAGASSYRLVVAGDSNFAATVLDSMVTGTLFTSDVLQTTGQSYWWRVTPKSNFGWGPVSERRSFSVHSTDVKQGEAPPANFALEQNYPNPFNPTTSIKYTVGGTEGGGRESEETGARGSEPALSGVEGLGTRKTRLIVYDVLGRQVATLVDEVKAPGFYQVNFDGSRLSSGVYFYRLTSGSFVQTRAMVLTK